MKLGVRGKLFLASLAAIAIVSISSGAYLSHALRDRIERRIEAELLRHARGARALLEGLGRAPSIEEADRIADELGEAADSRITIVSGDGTVLGDSELDIEGVRAVENHASRPEIRDALSKGRGESKRYSTTVEHDMLYLAVPFGLRDGNTGAVRASRPLAEVDEAILELYGVIVAAALLGIGLAVLVAWLSSHFLSRALKSLVDYAHRLSEGESVGPLHISRGDELGGIAGSVYRLSEQLEHHVAALALERDRFETVLDGMSEAVLALDGERRVNLINRAGILLLGLAGQPIGKTLLETIRLPDLHDLVSRLDAGGSDTAEFDLMPGGKRVLARATRRRSGETVIVLLDVTDLRRLESVRRDFVANVSHELRTPVSVIRANAETLLDGAIDDREAAGRFLESLVVNAERLARLISDLLDISRIESERFELSIERIEAGQALSRARAAVSDRAASMDIEVRVEPGEEALLMGDPRALDQVIFNLVDNAVKYTGAGGRVVLRALDRGETVRVEVEDDGPGVEPKHRSRLFERFYRVDPGRSREMGGTGLGLAIVKHLVTAMGGEVGMDPASVRGSVFWIELPAAAGGGEGPTPAS